MSAIHQQTGIYNRHIFWVTTERICASVCGGTQSLSANLKGLLVPPSTWVANLKLFFVCAQLEKGRGGGPTSHLFGEFKPHVKLQNPRTTPFKDKSNTRGEKRKTLLVVGITFSLQHPRTSNAQVDAFLLAVKHCINTIQRLKWRFDIIGIIWLKVTNIQMHV